MTPFQLGSVRVIFTAILLLMTGVGDLFGLSRKEWKWLGLSGVLGTLIPAFLFAAAQEHISSSMAALLNSLTPFNTFILSTLLYARRFGVFQIWGLALGVMGSIILVLSSGGGVHGAWQWSLLVVAATICYAFNANIIQQYLGHLRPLTVTKANFVAILIPALLIFALSGFRLDVQNTQQVNAILYLLVLSLFGTALAKILFNRLIQISSAVFGSLVTYTMPIMALFWGYMDGEYISLYQLLGGAIIIIGVYLTGKYARPMNQTRKSNT